MAKGTGGGSRTLPLLVLLALLGGVGAWNYQRNLAAEEALPRPYKGYSDADLQAMADAYEQEIQQYTKQWDQARGKRMQASTQGLVGDAADEFERVQGHTSQVRGLKRDLAERQVTLDQLREEIGYRSSMGKGWQLHLKRLTTF